jgi:hypothetical protein
MLIYQILVLTDVRLRLIQKARSCMISEKTANRITRSAEYSKASLSFAWYLGFQALSIV